MGLQCKVPTGELIMSSVGVHDKTASPGQRGGLWVLPRRAAAFHHGELVQELPKQGPQCGSQPSRDLRANLENWVD